MTNNNDIARLITSLEKQIAERAEQIGIRVRFYNDEVNHQFINDKIEFQQQLAEMVAKNEGLIIALQEAKAIAEGF